MTRPILTSLGGVVVGVGVVLAIAALLLWASAAVYGGVG
jgi:hypothetical protein